MGNTAMWLRCRKCTKTRVDVTMIATGGLRHNRSQRARSPRTSMWRVEVRCACGHQWWSTHEEATRLYEQYQQARGRRAQRYG